jgi:hypothetical protein
MRPLLLVAGAFVQEGGEGSGLQRKISPPGEPPRDISRLVERERELAALEAACTVSLSGGAGEFRSFRARALVSPPGGANGAYWAWDGRYSFGRPD